MFGGELSTGSWDALYLAACHLGHAAGTLLWLCSPKRAGDAVGRDGLFLGGEVPRGGRALPGRAPPQAGVLREKKKKKKGITESDKSLFGQSYGNPTAGARDFHLAVGFAGAWGAHLRPKSPPTPSPQQFCAN